jgi:signal transduction histidine kinase
MFRSGVSRGTWSYAILLLILCSIATLAVRQVLLFLETRLGHADFTVVSILISALSLGFMLIAGAFGLWAIQFAAGAESRRRIAELVDAMDYLSDGILAVDGKGRIRGANPASRELAGRSGSLRCELAEAFPCLAEDDIPHLLRRDVPHEVEHSTRGGQPPQARALRFRSQPSASLNLVIISDVTSQHAQQVRRRQAARLQLIGQLARGAAHDFNNLLCTISGHASLLPRFAPGSTQLKESLDAITESANRGVTLAGHLLGLAHPVPGSRVTDHIEEHIQSAVDTLRESLSSEWLVGTEVVALPPVGLTPLQIEQIVVNLGLLIADTVGPRGLLRVAANRPDANPLFNVGAAYAGAIVMTAGKAELLATSDRSAWRKDERETGLIHSIIESILEGNGGELEVLVGIDGSPVYRVALPLAAEPAGDAEEVPVDLSPYVAGWSVLLVKEREPTPLLEGRLRSLGAKVDATDSLVSALAHLEETPETQAVVVDASLMGEESRGLLRAMLKLRPGAGLVVLCEDPEAASTGGLAADIIFIRRTASMTRTLTAMVEARSLASRRAAG